MRGKKSKARLSKLLLQIKTAALITIAIPLAVDKTRATVEVAVQDHF